MTVLVVAGSRDLKDKDYPLVAEAIDRWRVEHHGVHHPATNPLTILEGGCRGADALAWTYCWFRTELRHERACADWKAHGKAAGPIRNQAMIDHADGLVVVRFRRSRGSADILRRAQAKGIPIVDVVLDDR